MKKNLVFLCLPMCGLTRTLRVTCVICNVSAACIVCGKKKYLYRNRLE